MKKLLFIVAVMVTLAAASCSTSAPKNDSVNDSTSVESVDSTLVVADTTAVI